MQEQSLGLLPVCPPARVHVQLGTMEVGFQEPPKCANKSRGRRAPLYLSDLTVETGLSSGPGTSLAVCVVLSKPVAPPPRLP